MLLRKHKIFALGALVSLTILFVECDSRPKVVRYLPILGISSVNANGDTFRNKIYVANFFFVTCPGICKQMNSELEDVQKVFAGNNKVKFLSFTVNPDQDSIPALLQYAKLHDAVPYQ